MQKSLLTPKQERLFKILAISLMLTGIAIRIAVYLQNRNFIIDEANVARNIHERGFMALLKPLSYEQYAPPVFLWLVKLSSIFWGFSEQALKVYPFLCGIASVYLFYLVLKQYVNIRSLWLPLSFLVFSCIFIRYSTELKQYASDVLATCALIYLALKTNIEKQTFVRFAIIWLVAGTIAIWSSMPSVFILAGVGAYFGWQALATKNYRHIGLQTGIYGIWLLQFLVYFITILEPQANSSYLQNFHRDNFLTAIPHNTHEWAQNWYNIEGLLVQIGGGAGVSIVFLLIIIIAGIIKLVKKDLQKGLLILVPLVCLFIAATVNQFSLMPRVSLFGIALLIVLSGVGYQYLTEKMSKAWMQIALLPFALFAIFGGIRDTYSTGFKYEELTTGLQFMKNNKITAPYLYMYHASGPAYIYYTEIHPENKKWEQLKKADILQWTTNYDSLGWVMKNVWTTPGPFAFVFTNQTAAEYRACEEKLSHALTKTKQLDEPGIKCLIYYK